MSKKKRGYKLPQTENTRSIMPEFREALEQGNTRLLDLTNGPEEVRLSDKIQLLIEPFTGDIDFFLLADCAAIAWNECVKEDFGSTGPCSLNNMLINFTQHRELIDMLKHRKRILFRWNRRHISVIKVYQKDATNFTINVASSMNLRQAFADLLSEMEDEFTET